MGLPRQSTISIVIVVVAFYCLVLYLKLVKNQISSINISLLFCLIVYT